MWSLAVKQAWWGDTRTKNTWLLFSKIDPNQVETPIRLHDPKGDRRRWQVMSKHQRSATVPAFAEWLVETARLASKAAPTLLEACKIARDACQDNLKMYMYKNEIALHEAFQACSGAVSAAMRSETNSKGSDNGPND